LKNCPYCHYSNYDNARVCRKCDGAFVATSATVYDGRTQKFGSKRAESIRGRALSMIVLGLLVKVYWGGYGPWPTIDFPILATIRTFAEPILVFGGLALYVFGWLANYI
jgi:hypothetical protein